MRRIAQARGAALYRAATCLALACTLAACGDSDDDGDGAPPAPLGQDAQTEDPFATVGDDELPGDDDIEGGFGAPGDGGLGDDGDGFGGGGSIASDLETAFVDRDNRELWICLASDAETDIVGYAFDPGGQGAYFLLGGNTISEAAEFDWQATGPDSVILEYPAEGVAEDITSIAFTDRGWTGSSSADGALDCELGSVGGA